ncbi:hypothetical protein WG66_006043 [Moniliophthora roreri]|nr:hypothetical protein WG66_006043 [Moniliophthora roreri]
MPSYTGSTPEFHYDEDKLMAVLKKYGPAFDTAWIHCVKWPETFCRPDRLISMMNGSIKKLKEQAKRKQRGN